MTGGNIYVDFKWSNITATAVKIPGVFEKIRRSLNLGKSLIFTNVKISSYRYTPAQGDIVHPTTIDGVLHYLLVARLFGATTATKSALYIDIDEQDNVTLLA